MSNAESLSFTSRCALSAAVKSHIANHHEFLAFLPTFSPAVQAMHTDGQTSTGNSAAEIIHDLGGMAAAW